MTQEPVAGGASDGAAPTEATLAQVESTLAAGDLASAVVLAEEALARGERRPLLLNLRALKAEVEGRFEDALDDLREAHALAPEDVSILNALGLGLMRLDLNDEAVSVLGQATASAPDFAQAWNNLGVGQMTLGRITAARASFERAAALQPGFAEPRGHLARLAARRGDHADARTAATEALRIKPTLSEAVQALAEVDLATGVPAEAERRLRELLDAPDLGPHGRYQATGLLGDALDRQARYPEAFAAYRSANEAQRKADASRFEGAGLLELVESLRRNFQRAWPRQIIQAPIVEASDAARQHIFLIGFMRSGTTLIEQVLAAQPDAVTMEEKEVLTSGVLEYLCRPDGMARLAVADEKALSAHRADYWARVRAQGIDYAGKIFVDKMPFNGLRLPLINRLFPDAKIIFTIRDPREVIFSCFKHRFSTTAYTYQLLDLPSAVRFYDVYMKSMESFRFLPSLQLHQYRHEDLVRDFDGVVGKICDFLGLPWNDGMRDVGWRARQGLVISPSARQLIDGLSTEGLRQWRRYEAQLTPFYVGLDPWVGRYGYD
jgi:tetratricopeptide (TPR) repeat protein